MSETQNQEAAPQAAENAAPAPEIPVAAAPAEEKHERLVESDLEAAHSRVLPLSPIESADEAPASGNAEQKNRGHRGLRRGNVGRGARNGKNAAQSVGVVENPGEVRESLSGKFVDGYDKDKDFRRAREQRRRNAEAAAAAATGETAPAAQGWCLTDSDDPHCRRHPQSNTNANRTKLIIEPAPIPEQEKDPSVWQKFKAKILSIFGLDKKKKKDKNRRGGKYRNKHGKKFYGDGKNGEFRKGDRNNGGNGEFRGGNRRKRRGRGPRPGNSGARPQQGGGNGNPPAAA